MKNLDSAQVRHNQPRRQEAKSGRAQQLEEELKEGEQVS